MRITGTVQWFDDKKGFGFIKTANHPENLFVHWSDIEGEGYRTLEVGQVVSLEEEQTPKGFHAINVKVTGLNDVDEENWHEFIDIKPFPKKDY
jgi:CspA family cold shock protein